MTDKNQNVKAEMGAEASSSKQELRDTDMEKVAGGTQGDSRYYSEYTEYGSLRGYGPMDKNAKEPDKAPGTDAGASSGTQTNTNDAGTSSGTQTNTNHSKGVQMINNSGANNAGGINM